MGERIHLGRNVTGENIAGTGTKDVFEISEKLNYVENIIE
jgi:hypothetical protein